jgi:hypothetical protein
VRKGGHPLLPYSLKKENRVNSDKNMAVWNEICKMNDKLTALLNAKKILVKRVKRDGRCARAIFTSVPYDIK